MSNVGKIPPALAAFRFPGLVDQHTKEPKGAEGAETLRGSERPACSAGLTMAESVLQLGKA